MIGVEATNPTGVGGTHGSSGTELPSAPSLDREVPEPSTKIPRALCAADLTKAFPRGR